MVKDKTSYHILVVEDNPGDFALVEDYLMDQIVDPTIFRAENYKAASEILVKDNIPFDVILLDLT